jgi:hypothetical protein
MKLLCSILLAAAAAVAASGQGCVGTPSVITVHVQRVANGQTRGVPNAIVTFHERDEWTGQVIKTYERRTNALGYSSGDLGRCRAPYSITAHTKRVHRGGFTFVFWFDYIPDGVPQTVVLQRFQ